MAPGYCRPLSNDVVIGVMMEDEEWRRVGFKPLTNHTIQISGTPIIGETGISDWQEMRQAVVSRLTEEAGERGLDVKDFEGAKDESNEIVDYCGISFRYIQGLFQRVLSGKEARGVELYVARTNVDDRIRRGDTLRLVKKLDKLGSSLLVRLRYSNEDIVIERGKVIFKPRTHWSIDDVCDHVVIPVSLKRNRFYGEEIGKAKYYGKPYQGIFVSQARRTRFQLLLDAVEQYLIDCDIPNKDAYVWMDVFCVNQGLTSTVHEKQEELNQLVTVGLHMAIARFERVAILFDEIDSPLPLTRAWCAWEMYGMAKTGRKADAIFKDEGAVESLVHWGDEEFGDYRQKFEVSRLVCHNPKDLELIQSAIKNLPGGADVLKEEVGGSLNTWMLAAMTRTIEEMLDIEKVDFTCADLAVNIGIIVAQLGRSEIAILLMTRGIEGLQLLQQHEAKVGDDLAWAHFNIAKVYEILGSYEEALRHYEQASSPSDTWNSDSIRLWHVEHAKALTLEHLGRYEEALESFETAIKHAKDWGVRKWILFSKLGVCLCLERLDRGNEARERYEDTREGSLRVVDDWGNEVEDMYEWAESCLRHGRDSDKATDLLTRIMANSDDPENTPKTHLLLVDLLNAKSKYNEALRELEKEKERCIKEYGRFGEMAMEDTGWNKFVQFQAWINLATREAASLLGLGRREEARSCLNEINHNYPHPLVRVPTLLNTIALQLADDVGDCSSARELMDAFWSTCNLKRMGCDFIGFWVYCLVHMQAGEFRKALKMVKKGIALCRWERGDVLDLEDNFMPTTDDPEKDIDVRLRSDEQLQLSRLHLVKADIYLGLGLPKKSLKSVGRAQMEMNCDPSDSFERQKQTQEMKLLLGHCLRETGEIEKALETITELLEEEDKLEEFVSIGAHFALGVIHQAMGVHEKAIDVFHHILSETGEEKKGFAGYHKLLDRRAAALGCLSEIHLLTGGKTRREVNAWVAEAIKIREHDLGNGPQHPHLVKLHKLAKKV